MKIVASFCCALMLTATLVVPSSAGSPAMGQLKLTVNGILELLQNEKDSDQFITKVEELVYQRFDFEKMSKYVLGIHWRRLTPIQRNQFVQKFTQLLRASYIDRIDNYSDEKVEFVGEHERRGKALIETEVVTANQRIPIHYKMAESKGAWRVYDVVVEGVSLVRNYRGSYNDILRQEGFEKLILRMDNKIHELNASKNRFAENDKPS